jgi:glyoxylase-like metal-dependent hydrolase (beta-lactamase superfamily II)
MVSLAAGLEYFDLNFRGIPGVIACAMLHGADGVALIDPGPSTTIPALRAALETRGVGARDVRALLVTHIHLDHAGASGVLMDLFPEALLHVHRAGAPHMIDPSRLLRSASRLYGDEMEALWGEVRPVPATRVRVLDTGPSPGDPVLRLQTVGHDLEVAYTPGHASHHVSFFHPASRIAFVGDTAGLCRQSGRLVIPATPPPDIDLPIWRESTRRILAWEPGTLFLTHFGPHRSPRVHMQDLWTRIDAWTRLVEAGAAWPGTDADRAREFAARVADDITRATDRAEADGYQRAGRFDFSWQGLRRYLGREELRK